MEWTVCERPACPNAAGIPSTQAPGHTKPRAPFFSARWRARRAVSMLELLIVVTVNYLNGAVMSYNQSAQELNTNASEGVVLALLKTRNAALPGSPFLPGNLKTTMSSNTSTYRAQWSNRIFIMVPTNTVGSGLDLLKLM